MIKDHRILITGCAGTIGTFLLKQLADGKYGPAEVIGVDNNESELFFLEQQYLDRKDIRFSLADIRDISALTDLMRGIDIVVHCAGYKHVIMCERSPFDAVQTNIYGVQNIIHAAMENGVKRVLFTSTDKAVNPTNVMGTSKLMGERLMTAANSRFRGDGTIFSSTRFGNVLGSRGSVIPIFREQIRKGGPVTLTDNSMTRFIMSIEESASLVLDSINLMCGGEVFITKMPIIRIRDLAEVMISVLAPRYGYDPADVSIRVIGIKPGEKLYEELMTGDEASRAVELKHYFAIKPAFTGIYRQIAYSYPDQIADTITRPYVSADGPFLAQGDLLAFLEASGLLDSDTQRRDFPERYWPGDKTGD